MGGFVRRNIRDFACMQGRKGGYRKPVASISDADEKFEGLVSGIMTEEIARFGFGDKETASYHRAAEIIAHGYDNMAHMLFIMADTGHHQEKCLMEIGNAYRTFRSSMEGLQSPELDILFRRDIKASKDEATARFQESAAETGKVRNKMLRMISSNPSTAKAISAELLEERFRPALRILIANSIVGMLDNISIYRELPVVEDIERFFGSFMTISKGFVERARGKRDLVEWDRLAAFKLLCHSQIISNAYQSNAYMPDNRSRFLTMAVASDIANCPAMLSLDDSSLERLEGIARSIINRRTALSLQQNAHWAASPCNSEHLRELLSTLDRAIGRGGGAMDVFPMIERRHLLTACRFAKAVEDDPELLAIYGRHFKDERGARTHFLEYALDVAPHHVGNNTFHEIFMQAYADLSPEDCAMVVRNAPAIYLSGAWLDLALLLTGNETERDAGRSALEEFEKGGYVRACSIIDDARPPPPSVKDDKQVSKIRAEFKDATDEQIAFFEAMAERLGSLEIEWKAFASLRRKGVDTMISTARLAEKLDDAPLRTIFNSERCKAIFAKAAAMEANGDLAERVNNIAENAGEDGQAQDDDLVQAIIGALEKSIEVETRINAGGFKRIVLVVNERGSKILAEQLERITGIEVKQFTDLYPHRSDLQRLIVDGDAVIVETSHLTHVATGTVVAVCRTKGIPFFIGSQTNAMKIAQRIRNAPKQARRNGEGA